MDLKPKNDSVGGSHQAPGACRCWCGGVGTERVRSDYASCPDCGTVMYSEPYDLADYAASDAASFYGDRYWRHHVPEHLGLPGLEERARTDLPERAVFHLERVLRYVGPGARILELGCGSGSLTYLLGQAGFDAVGLEMAPAAIELARDRFGVEVVQGPLEVAELTGSFDAVVAIDVLEHLPRPLATLELCVGRLKEGGALFLQTPRYNDQGADWEMLLPREHLFLFTAESVERLLRVAGFATVEVGDSLFPHDMWIDAALGPLSRRSQPTAGIPPIAQALIDAHGEVAGVRDELAGVDADRRSKEQSRQALDQELASARADQQVKEELIRLQAEDLAGLRADQQEKGRLIDRLSSELAEVRQDQAAKGELIDRLSEELAEVRQDQAAKGELIDRHHRDLATELEQIRQDQTAKGELIDLLSAELATVRADQQAKETVITALDAELARHRAELARHRAELAHHHAELLELRSDRVYRALRAVRARFGRRWP